MLRAVTSAVPVAGNTSAAEAAAAGGGCTAAAAAAVGAAAVAAGTRGCFAPTTYELGLCSGQPTRETLGTRVPGYSTAQKPTSTRDLSTASQHTQDARSQRESENKSCTLK